MKEKQKTAATQEELDEWIASVYEGSCCADVCDPEEKPGAELPPEKD